MFFNISIYITAQLDGWMLGEEKKGRKRKQQKHSHVQSLNFKRPSLKVKKNLSLLVPTKALDTHKRTNTHKSTRVLTHAHASGRPISAGWKRQAVFFFFFFWSNVSMTTFNWTVNQLLICLSAAWCEENETEKEWEREKKRVRWERKKGRQCLSREMERGKSGTCMCMFV